MPLCVGVYVCVCVRKWKVRNLSWVFVPQSKSEEQHVDGFRKLCDRTTH